jgi:hypothetical protein
LKRLKCFALRGLFSVNKGGFKHKGRLGHKQAQRGGLQDFMVVEGLGELVAKILILQEKMLNNYAEFKTAFIVLR